MTTSSAIPEARRPVDLTSWDLVTAAQNGDRDAFGQLYDRYVDVVFRFVLSRVSDRALAEDLTSETFLRALRRIDSVSYQGRDVGAWFITIARNLVLDHVASSRYRLELLSCRIGHEELGTHIDNRTPEQEILAAESSAVVLRCLDRLAQRKSMADQAECLRLRFLVGLSVSDTAEVMGRNVGALKALQHRAVHTMAGIPELVALGEVPG